MSKDFKLEQMKSRKAWISIQVFFIAVITLMLTWTIYVYCQPVETVDVDYVESCDANYGVYINNLDGLYGSEPVVVFGKSDTLSTFDVASVKKIVISFDYKNIMNVLNAEYEYKYWVDSQFIVRNVSTGTDLLNETKTLVSFAEGEQNTSNSLNLSSGQLEVLLTEYISKYNQQVSSNDVENYKCELVVKMHVNISNELDSLDINEFDSYVTISLSGTNISISYSSSPSNGVISQCNIYNKYRLMSELFLCTLVPGLVVLLLILFLFIKFTKIIDVDNTNEENELVNSDTNEKNIEITVNDEKQMISEETPEDRLNYSFEAKLILSDAKTKEFYQDIVNFSESYGVKVVRSFKRERIYLGRDLFAVLVFKGKSLCVCLPLNPSEYVDTNYKYQDMSAYKKYEETPFLMKLTSGLKVRHVNELLESLFLKAGVKNQNKAPKEVIIPVKSKQELYEEGQIKFKDSILSSKKTTKKEEY